MQEKAHSNTEKKHVGLWIVVVLLACLILGLILLVPRCRRKPVEVPARQPPGERFAFDDFYHTEDGRWTLETPVDLLKEQKYVSGEAERERFLVYAAQPAETVVIRSARGRWKQVDVVDGESIVATGWVDANDKQARLLP